MNLSLVRSLLAAASLLSLPGSALAHGAWIAERWGELGIIYGHGAGDDAYDPAKVTEVSAHDAAAAPVKVDVERQETHAFLSVDKSAVVIAMVFDNGFWSEGADGKWVNKPKNEVPGARSGGHYVKNNITLLHSDGPLPAFPPQKLQIVPLSNPTGLKAGDPLKVRVQFDGAPLAGVELTIDYINASGLKSAKTDANGEVEIALRNDGLNVLAVDHSVPLSNDPAADKIGYTATLSFVAADHVDE